VIISSVTSLFVRYADWKYVRGWSFPCRICMIQCRRGNCMRRVITLIILHNDYITLFSILESFTRLGFNELNGIDFLSFAMCTYTKYEMISSYLPLIHRSSLHI